MRATPLPTEVTAPLAETVAMAGALEVQTGVTGTGLSFEFRMTIWSGIDVPAGPMTRTVADAALMLSVIAAWDGRDPYALPPAKHDFLGGLDGARSLLK